ncbi:MAG: hypothetical protein ACE5NG_04515 [bacterium]
MPGSRYRRYSHDASQHEHENDIAYNPQCDAQKGQECREPGDSDCQCQQKFSDTVENRCLRSLVSQGDPCEECGGDDECYPDDRHDVHLLSIQSSEIHKTQNLLKK